MKIILYKDIPSLGEEGDVKNVADGYARNYLIPKKIAVRYTKATEMELTQKQQSIARRKTEKMTEAADLKTRIEAIAMDLSVAAGENGRLFGSVTSSAIVDFLSSKGIEIERKRVELPDGGIKTVGKHVAKVRLYGKNDALLTVNVTPVEVAEPAPAPKAPRKAAEKAAAPAAEKAAAPAVIEADDVPVQEDTDEEES
jgi:large subunit ribosomal protein L9